MHFITKPGTSLEEEDRITTAPARSSRPIPACATSAPTSAGPWSPTRSSGRTSPRTGSASTRRRPTTRRWPRSRRSSTATPALPRRADLPQGAHQGGADRRERAIVVRIFGPDLDVLRDEGGRGREDAARRRRPDRGAPDSSRRCPRYGRGRPGGGGAVRAEAGRRAPRLVDAARGREVGDIYRAARVRRPGLEHPRGPPRASTTSANLRIDTPTRATVRLADVAAVEVQTTPNAIRHEDCFRRIDVLRQRPTAATSARSSHDVEDAVTRSTSRSATTPSCWANTRSARARSDRLLSVRADRRRRDLPAPHPVFKRSGWRCWRS